MEEQELNTIVENLNKEINKINKNIEIIINYNTISTKNNLKEWNEYLALIWVQKDYKFTIGKVIPLRNISKENIKESTDKGYLSIEINEKLLEY